MSQRRTVAPRPRFAALALGVLAAVGTQAGCATAPPLDNPILIRHAPVENPVLVSPGQPTAESYREVFEKVVEVLDDYFELQNPNPYAGSVTTKPRVAPGYEQFWKPGNPDARQRLLATFQSIRQTATAEIRAGDRGGYLVYVVVEKELEDLPRPIRATVGNAVFQEGPTVARESEVVGPDSVRSGSFYKVGRDYAFEQLLLRRIRECR
ncbi:MAG: hypothetical protein K2V38_12855 [Gemmataceae bacterium]|nr:hypothetical protein [Gemmataceae bacterium]